MTNKGVYHQLKRIVSILCFLQEMLKENKSICRISFPLVEAIENLCYLFSLIDPFIGSCLHHSKGFRKSFCYGFVSREEDDRYSKLDHLKEHLE